MSGKRNFTHSWLRSNGSDLFRGGRHHGPGGKRQEVIHEDAEQSERDNTNRLELTRIEQELCK